MLGHIRAPSRHAQTMKGCKQGPCCPCYASPMQPSAALWCPLHCTCNKPRAHTGTAILPWCPLHCTCKQANGAPRDCNLARSPFLMDPCEGLLKTVYIHPAAWQIRREYGKLTSYMTCSWQPYKCVSRQALGTGKTQ